jgi:hypothetical protein
VKVALVAAVVLWVALAAAVNFHHRGHAAHRFTGCPRLSRCIQRRMEVLLTGRGESGTVTAYCQPGRADPVVCVVTVTFGSDDDLCLWQRYRWPSLALVDSVDVSTTRLCGDLLT